MNTGATRDSPQLLADTELGIERTNVACDGDMAFVIARGFHAPYIGPACGLEAFGH
jgi:hypothetical protein